MTPWVRREPGDGASRGKQRDADTHARRQFQHRPPRAPHGRRAIRAVRPGDQSTALHISAVPTTFSDNDTATPHSDDSRFLAMDTNGDGRSDLLELRPMGIGTFSRSSRPRSPDAAPCSHPRVGPRVVLPTRHRVRRPCRPSSSSGPWTQTRDAEGYTTSEA